MNKNKIKKSFLNRSLNIKNNTSLLKNHYYIVSSGTCFISKRLLDSCIRVIRFHVRRATTKKNKRFINFLQLNLPVTKKSKKTRMGAGKGKVRRLTGKIHRNSILFIFRRIKPFTASKVFKSIQHHFPIKLYLKYIN